MSRWPKGYKKKHPERDYEKETRYENQPEQVDRRVERNKDRRTAERKGLVRKGDNKEVDHVGFHRVGSLEGVRTRVVAKSTNRKRQPKRSQMNETSKQEAIDAYISWAMEKQSRENLARLPNGPVKTMYTNLINLKYNRGKQMTELKMIDYVPTSSAEEAEKVRSELEVVQATPVADPTQKLTSEADVQAAEASTADEGMITADRSYL